MLARKINKIPELYMIFARKMPDCYIIARKIFSRFFFLGGGHVSHYLPFTPPSSPVSNAYRPVYIMIALEYGNSDRLQAMTWLFLVSNDKLCEPDNLIKLIIKLLLTTIQEIQGIPWCM